jgi:hypothetical protein
MCGLLSVIFLLSFFSYSNMSYMTISPVPEKEVIQDSCCQCGEAFNVQWDAWSGTYYYPYEWEEYTVFCSSRCLQRFEQTLCYSCNQPRSCCLHAQMEYDYAEEADEVEEDEKPGDYETCRMPESYCYHARLAELSK